MQCLEYAQKLVKFLPADAVSFDDASNNRALISGKSALIFNPPSAWAVAKRDAPTGRGGLLDLLGADRAEGPLRADRDVLLGHLEVQQEPDGRQGADGVPDAAEQVEARDNAVAGLRHPALREAERLQDLGRGRAAEGHGVQLSDPAMAQCQAEPDRVRGIARHGGADLQPARSTTRWWRSSSRGRRSRRSSPGRRTNWRASCADRPDAINGVRSVGARISGRHGRRSSP